MFKIHTSNEWGQNHIQNIENMIKPPDPVLSKRLDWKFKRNEQMLVAWTIRDEHMCTARQSKFSITTTFQTTNFTKFKLLHDGAKTPNTFRWKYYISIY